MRSPLLLRGARRALALAIALLVPACMLFNDETEAMILDCLDDGECAESCLCKDCDNYGACYSVVGQCPDLPDAQLAGCCIDDGVCDGELEGCGCADCAAHPNCADNRAACDGGAPDGQCDPDESCLCPECTPSVRCALATCTADSVCEAAEACICPECITDGLCPPTGCYPTSPGVCDPLNETCLCHDCDTAPPCVPLNEACDGGARDDMCGVVEDCACPDCALDDRCTK